MLNRFTRVVNTSVQLDDELITESSLARVEEGFELAQEVREYLVDQLSLHRRCQLLVKRVLFNNQVKVEVESIFHSLLDTFAELGWKPIRCKLAIRQLKLTHPDVRLVKSGGQELVE